MKCQSFKPFADARSRILILGTMPGPEALRRQEFYGFPGNHFWKIMFRLFDVPETQDYKQKLALLRREHIALWDTIDSCSRIGAADSAIRDIKPNPIDKLIRSHKDIRTIFLNGKTAEKLYNKHFGDKIQIASFTLPSTSPAHASMSFEAKLREWSVIKKFLTTRNPWC